MSRISLDAYVVDVLMPDLIGHDHRPAAFVVYLLLLRQTLLSHRDTVAMSLQTIATRTGLAKSTVQAALRHLRRRRLLDPLIVATPANPVRGVLRPWERSRYLPPRRAITRS
jgi:IclR-like helix-turn-helix domain-containing protein